MATEPKIYRKNFIDSYTTLSVTSGSATKNRLWDRDRDVQWSSSGESTAGTLSVITAQFNTPAGAATAKTVDTMILLNHNITSISFESSPDGAIWTSRASGVLGTGVYNNLITISPISAPFWKFYGSHTTPVDGVEKIAGEWILTSVLLDPGVELDSYEVSYRQMAPEIQLADGSVHRTVVKWTQGRSAKYEFSGRMSYLTFTQLESLRSLKESGAAFYWQPESTTRLQEIYYVNWTGPFRYRYVTSYKGAGFQVDFQFKEI
jgi:hypothetical protein